MNAQVGEVSQLVAAIVAGRSLTEAAEVANMSVSTAQRRLREPEIAQLVDEERREQTREALGRLRSMRRTALDELEKMLLLEMPASAKLKVIDLVLRQGAMSDRDSDEEVRRSVMTYLREIRGMVETVRSVEGDER